MFDFAGYISTSQGRQALRLESAWENNEALPAIDYRTDQFTNGRFQLYALSREGEQPDRMQQEGLFVAVYGACYTRQHAESGLDSRRVAAGEIAKQYRSGGFGFLDQLKGSFILLISDSRKEKTFFISDPLSLRSLYYRETRDGLLFSSSLAGLKRLLEAHDIEVNGDGASIIEYYLFDFTLGDHTMLKGVRELQAGKLLELGDDGMDLRSYCDPYELFPLTDKLLEEKEAGELLTNTLKKNIELLTDGPQDTALALTGGYDSRSIAALAGDDFNKYQYYSYGAPHSWDIKIPRLLARKNHLHHEVIDLSGEFKKEFAVYARQAMALGDGIAEASRANFLYVYSNFLRDKKSILSGLFGSELIKIPSSRGLFIDENILSVLRAEDPEQAFDQLYDGMLNEGIFDAGFARLCRQEVKWRVLNNPLVCNRQPMNKKLFYFILLIGCRKYFVKEIKLERFFIQNKTPFFDIDFIQALLLTPFPWVYNWTREKSLIKNLKIHRVYAGFISRKKGLMNTISTHGFQPGYLLSKWYYPLLGIQFFRTKKKIARESHLSFDEDIRSFFSQERQTSETVLPMVQSRLQKMEQSDFKNFIKLNSLNYWMAEYGIQLPRMDQSILK